MPVYDFICHICSFGFEAQVHFSETPYCPSCEKKEEIVRLFPAPRLGLKYPEMKRAERKGDRVRSIMKKDLESEK